MLIIEEYIKVRFRKKGPLCYYLEAKRSKILQILNKKDCFCNILSLIMTFLAKKTDLYSKYIFKFAFGSVFEQDHQLNSLNLGVYEQR